MHFVEVKSILSQNNGMNIYRGCSHGCIYCDSRSECYDMKHAFEDIEVKKNAPQLLYKALSSKRNKCMISTGSMCDPYLHIEKRLCLTRQCLEIIDELGFGVCVLTKSDLIMRDLNLLEEINRKTKAVVQMTLTTYDEKLSRIVEPNVCTTKRRLEVLKECQRRGIPTVVWLCPLLPFINDNPDNLRAILQGCADCGVKGIVSFGMGLTLRKGDREYFYQKLDEHFPGMKESYMAIYGERYELPSMKSKELQDYFVKFCKEKHIMYTEEACFKYLREFPQAFEQTQLF